MLRRNRSSSVPVSPAPKLDSGLFDGCCWPALPLPEALGLVRVDSLGEGVLLVVVGALGGLVGVVVGAGPVVAPGPEGGGGVMLPTKSG